MSITTQSDIDETLEQMNEFKTNKMHSVQEEAPADPVVEEAPVEAVAPSEPVVEKKHQVTEFQELARRDRKSRELQQQNKKLQSELEDLRQYKQNNAEFMTKDQLLAEARRSPAEFVKQYGLTIDDVANSSLNDGQTSEALRTQNELADMRKQVNELKNLHAESSKKEQQLTQDQSYKKFIDEIKNFVDNKKEDFELIGLQDSYDLVGNVIREHYQATGDVMPYDRACNLVEDHLTKSVEQLLGSSKFSKYSLREEVAQTEEQAVQEKAPITGNTPSTLTNKNAASPSAVDENIPRSRLLSPEASIEELSEQFNFFG